MTEIHLSPEAVQYLETLIELDLGKNAPSASVVFECIRELSRVAPW